MAYMVRGSRFEALYARSASDVAWTTSVQEPAEIQCGSISLDGRSLATGTGTAVRLRRAERGGRLSAPITLHGHDAPVQSAILSLNAEWLLTEASDGARIWRLEGLGAGALTEQEENSDGDKATVDALLDLAARRQELLHVAVDVGAVGEHLGQVGTREQAPLGPREG